MNDQNNGINTGINTSNMVTPTTMEPASSNISMQSNNISAPITSQPSIGPAPQAVVGPSNIANSSTLQAQSTVVENQIPTTTNISMEPAVNNVPTIANDVVVQPTVEMASTPAVDMAKPEVNNTLENPAPTATEPPSFVKPIEVVPDENDLLSAVPRPDIMISSPQNTSIETDVLIEDFTGDNYDKISSKKFNIAALLGGAYMLYRKMYVIGGIVTMITFVIFYFMLMINPLLSPVAMLLVSIVLFFIFNTLYINISKKKIDKIKDRYKTMSVSELKKLCSKKGGTNLVVAIVATLLVSAFSYILMSRLFPIDFADIGTKIQESLSGLSKPSSSSNGGGNNQTPQQTNIDLNSIAYKEDINLSEIITMQYLTIFKPTDKNTNYMYNYIIYTTPDDESTYCKFNLAAVNGYTSSATLISELANHYGEAKNVNTVTTNAGVTWNIFKIQDNGVVTNVAAANNGDTVYLFTYEIAAAADPSWSLSWYEGVLQSIKFN